MALFQRKPPLPHVRRNAPARVIERGLGAIALLACLFLIGGAVTVKHLASESIEASRDAARAYQLKLELLNLSSSLASAEASSRAYAMNGRPTALEPYQASRTEAELSESALRPLTFNTPFQSTDLGQLENLVKDRFTTLSRANTAREESGAESARALLDSPVTLNVATRLHVLLRSMQDAEQTSLNESLARQAKNNDLAATAMVSTVVLLAAIAFAFWGTLKREFMIRERLERKLSDTVTEDELTGAINRSAFERLLDQEWAFRLRYATPLSMLLIEIDNLAEVNERFGLARGDLMLRDISRRLLARLRATEHLARYGGQQFAVLVPQSLNDAARLGRQLAELILATPYPILDGEGAVIDSVKVELSIGVADASDVNAAPSLILATGEALYSAKQDTDEVRVAIYLPGMREANSQALKGGAPQKI